MPIVAVRPKSTFAGLYAAELLVLGFGGLAVALYAILDLPLRPPFWLWWERMSNSVPCYALALLLVLCFLRLSHLRASRARKQLIPHSATWAVFKENYLDWRKTLKDFRFINVVCLMFVVFVNLKHLIPYVNELLLDRYFFKAESSFFRGQLAGELLIEHLGSGAAPLLSSCYTLFYPYVAVLIYLFILSRDERFIQEFLFAFCLTWFLGILLVYAVPTVGPVFFEPQLFASLPATEVFDMQVKLARHREVLESFPAHPAATYLISGFPSLHLAIVVLGSLYLQRARRWLAVLSWMFVVVTAVTTLYFGWHYVMDDIGGIALAMGAYRIAIRRFHPRYVFVPEVMTQKTARK